MKKKGPHDVGPLPPVNISFTFFLRSSQAVNNRWRQCWALTCSWPSSVIAIGHGLLDGPIRPSAPGKACARQATSSRPVQDKQIAKGLGSFPPIWGTPKLVENDGNRASSPGSRQGIC